MAAAEARTEELAAAKAAAARGGAGLGCGDRTEVAAAVEAWATAAVARPLPGAAAADRGVSHRKAQRKTPRSLRGLDRETPPLAVRPAVNLVPSVPLARTSFAGKV